MEYATRGNPSSNSIENIQTVVAMLLSQSVLPRLSTYNSARNLLAVWLLFAFVLSTAYKGSLIAFLTLPKYPPRVETIEDLVNTVDR